MASSNRPLSPHLQVYRPQITSVVSIIHRICGVSLMFGTVLFTYWLTSAGYGPAAFERAQAVMGSWLGQLIMFGFTFALYYHTANGLRHMAWDLGLGFEMTAVNKTGMMVVAFSLIMTGLTWYVALSGSGGL